VSEIEHSVDFLPPKIVLDGSLLYILKEDGVDLIDVANPDSPRMAGVVQNPASSGASSGDPPGLVRGIDGFIPPDTFLDMAVSGQYLYIAASDGGLWVIDVSDPDNPQEMGHLELPDRAAHVATSGDSVAVLGVDEVGDEDDLSLSFALHRIDPTVADGPQIIETVAVPDVTLPFQLLLLGENSTVLLDPARVYVLGGSIDPTGNGNSPPAAATADSAAATSTMTIGSEVTNIPTPMGNLWRGLSFEQAQEIVPFPLIRPDLALSWVTIEKITALAPPSPNVEQQVPNEATVYLIVDNGDSGEARVALIQTSLQSQVSTGPDATETTVVISGREITQVIQERVGDPIITYSWSNEDVSYTLMSAAGVEEERLEEIIASMI
jgi:hypothetical protein